jgi:hypothetical protein
MIEVLLLLAAAADETEERYTLVSIDQASGRVRHWTAPISGSGIRQLLIARGEDAWCINARVALARQQWADADCHTQLRTVLSPDCAAPVADRELRANVW